MTVKYIQILNDIVAKDDIIGINYSDHKKPRLYVKNRGQPHHKYGFNENSKALEKIKEILLYDNENNEIKKLKKTVEKLEKKIHELEEQIKYLPVLSDEYKKVEREFASISI